MIIMYGERVYGKCDVVPELFYVGTFFFHVNFLPLIPLRSMIILEESNQQYYGVKIGLSLKSIVLGWARVAFFLLSCMMIMILIAALVDADGREKIAAFTVLLPLVLLVVGIWVALMLIPRQRKPAYERACKLALKAGLTDRGWAALNVLYGQDPLYRPPGAPPAVTEVAPEASANVPASR